MDEKIVLVTGATNGIGKETARELARMGATVIVAGRDEAKTTATVDEIKSVTGNENVRRAVADLSIMAQVRELAEAFHRRYDRLDVLVNNAGAIFTRRQVTPEGFELTWALNHLNYFLLTNLLRDLLKKAAARNGEARVINVSSDAHFGARKGIRFDDPNFERDFNGFGAYSHSKLANILFSNELARKLEGTGVTSNAVHPGGVATGFAKNNGPLANVAVTLFSPFMKSPEDGARTSVYVASSPALRGMTGKYFADSKEKQPSKAAQDDAAARRLWELSTEQTGLTAAVW